MGYGTTAKLFVNGSGFGIEAGQISQKEFTNAIFFSQEIDRAPPWNTPGGITVTKMALASDMPVGGRNVFRILDNAGTAFYEQDAPFPLNIVNGDGSERPIVFSCYIALEAYPQDNSRIEARLTLANANTIDFTVDFNPNNGLQASTNFVSTEPGFASGECAVFINAFEGMNGVSAFRINLTIFARGLTGASEIASMRLRLRPDTVGAVGSFLDVTAAQIAIPFGTCTTADFGLPPYVPTADNQASGPNSKITYNALDLSYHLAPIVSPYQFDYYADLGAGKTVNGGEQFDLPVTSADTAPGWWTIVGSTTGTSFDIGIAAGQTLVLGSAPSVFGPAVHTVNNANVLFWKIVKLGNGEFGLFPLFSDPAGGGGGLVLLPFQAALGATIDFTGLPAGIKRFSVMFNQTSTNGASNYLIQLGTAAGFDTTVTYDSAAILHVAPATHVAAAAAHGFVLTGAMAAGVETHGIITFDLTDGGANFVSNGVLSAPGSPSNNTSGGRKLLASALTQVRITTAAGVDLFVLGHIALSYET